MSKPCPRHPHRMCVCPSFILRWSRGSPSTNYCWPLPDGMFSCRSTSIRFASLIVPRRCAHHLQVSLPFFAVVYISHSAFVPKLPSQDVSFSLNVSWIEYVSTCILQIVSFEPWSAFRNECSLLGRRGETFLTTTISVFWISPVTPFQDKLASSCFKALSSNVSQLVCCH